MKRLILLIFCLFSIVSWGQAIKGKVIDADTKETIPGATISVPGMKGGGTQTNLDGEFSFTMPTGKTQIQVSYVGYKTKTVNVQPGSTVTVSLQSDAQSLDDIVVIGYGTQKKENLSASVATVNVSKTIDSRPIPDIGRALQGTTPGLTVTLNNGELGADPKFRIRGQRTSINAESNPLILVDNVEIPTITYVNPDDVESISILKDAAASSIYGAKAANGVILIKTKNGSSKADGSVSVNYSGSFSFRMATTVPGVAGFNGYEFFTERSNSNRSAAYPTPADSNINSGGFWYMATDLVDRARYWNETYGGMSTFEPMVYGRDWETKGLRGAATGSNYGYRVYDIYESMYKNWSPMNKHNISIGGRAGKTSYNIGLGYTQQIGFLRETTDTYAMYNASVSINTEVTKFFTARASMRFTKTEKRFPNSEDGTTADALTYALRWGAYYPQGAVANNGLNNRDAISQISQSNILTDTKQYLAVNIGGTLKILKGWTADLDVTYAMDNRFLYYPGYWPTYNDIWNPATERVLDADGNQIWRDRDGNIVAAGTEDASPEYTWAYINGYTKGQSPDRVNEESRHSERVELTATTSYKATFGQHSFAVLAGINTSSYRYFSNSSTKLGLIYPDRPYFNLAEGTQMASGSRNWQSQAGWFGRIDYSFKDRYIIQVNGRYDGTSKYPTDLRWKFFPSVSAAYIMSEENFMKNIKDVLSFLKFRVSYGSLGNQAIGSGNYIPTLAKSGTSYWGNYNGDLQWEQYASPSIVRSDVTWETISTLGFGIDARFWKNKLGVSFDWYNRKTTDMFVPGGSVPNTYGASAPNGNFGTMRTNGWELALDFNHTFKNGLNLAVTAGVSDAESKILKYTDATVQNINGNIASGNWYSGQTLGEIWGYKVDRLYQMNDFSVWEQLNGTSVPSGMDGVWYYGKLYTMKPGMAYSNNLAYGYPGAIKYKDINKDGAITGGDGTVQNPGDRTIIGNFTPRYEYNFRVDLNWKGFDLSVFFQGVGKRDYWGRGPLVSPSPYSDGAAVSKIIDNTWTEANPGAYWPRLNMINSDSYTEGLWQQSDKYLLDMSYLRLKQLTLGYTIPQRLTKKISINRLRAYFTVENLFCINNLQVPIDPEIDTGNMSAGANYASGRLGINTPLPKYYTLGLQLGL